jgi:hypothetical protein
MGVVAREGEKAIDYRKNPRRIANDICQTLANLGL